MRDAAAALAKAFVIAFVIVAIVVTVKMSKKKEGFLDEFRYRPCNLSFDRVGCKGFTSGMPPSIETDAEGDFSCCGYIGVPP